MIFAEIGAGFEAKKFLLCSSPNDYLICTYRQLCYQKNSDIRIVLYSKVYHKSAGAV